MSQQINGVVGGDAHTHIKGENTSFEVDINEIPLHATGSMHSTPAMESFGNPGSRKQDCQAEVKGGVCDFGKSDISGVDNEVGATIKKESETSLKGVHDVYRGLAGGGDPGNDGCGNIVTNQFTEGSLGRDCSGDLERAALFDSPFSGSTRAGRKKRVGRPRSKRGAGRGNISFDHYQSEDANSPVGGVYLSTSVGTPTFTDSGRGDKRRRGRPRGSRGSGRGAISFESKALDDVYSGASDSGDTEATGSNFSDSGLGGGVTSPHTVPITRAGRGALRPGCKSYRGRAAAMGRGFRVNYAEDSPSSWNVSADTIPLEYESALSPSPETVSLGKRRLSLPDRLPPSIRAKRGSGSRGRSRGRPRGRRPRSSFDHDSAMDNDSSDIGTPGFDTPVFNATDLDSPDPRASTRSDEGTPVVTSKSRRSRGRGSRGGRGSEPKVVEDKLVICFACKESMNNNTYVYHKLKAHNGLTWRDGLDEPIDLNDEKLVKSILKQTLSKRKQLICEKCGVSRSSIVGYESHLTFCAKSEGEREALMETCPVCSRRMMPASLKVHMSVHRQEKKAKEKEVMFDSPVDSGPIDPGEGSSTSSGKLKRAAANRAVSLMQSFIKGEDVGLEEAPKQKISSDIDLKELYSGKKKTSPDGTEGSPKKNGEPNPYQVAAWMRMVQRHGKANCRNPGCPFNSTVKKELIEHYKTCTLKPKINYTCKLCSFGCEEEEEIEKHLKSAHLEGSEDEEDAAENSSEVELEESEEGSGWDTDELGDGAKELAEGSVEPPKPPKKKRKVEKKPKVEKEEKPPDGTQGTQGTPKSAKYTKNVHFLAKHGLYRRGGLSAYIATLRWTLEFQLSNFSMQPLYTEWRPYAKDWIHLDEKEYELYLPTSRISPRFATRDIISDLYKPGISKKKIDPSFIQLPLFGTSIKPSKNSTSSQSGFITMFVGGPVWAQAWCPTPLHINCYRPTEGSDGIDKEEPPSISQFLAVSCNPSFDSYHYLWSRISGEKFMIQIWDCGPLSNSESAHLVPPVMALGIAHDFGPVWALEWCPSGCHDVDEEFEEMHGSGTVPATSNESKPLKRLGLLAAACGDGTIRLIPVPFPSELTKGNPVFKSCKRDSPANRSSSAKASETPPSEATDKSEEIIPRTGVDSEGNDVSNKCVEVEEVTSESKSSIKLEGMRSTKELPSPSALSGSGVFCSESGADFRSVNEASEVNQSLPIFKPSSVITLVVNSCSTDDPLENCQCLCLSWSLLGKSHSVLAAGFSNGLIALWDLKTSSPLLRVDMSKEDNGFGLVLRPYHMFFSHKNAVTAVALAVCSPEERLRNGERHPRYLISGSRDRFVKVWDLQDTAAPLSSYPRGLVTSIAWLTNWMSFVCSVDDSFACGRANSKAQALRSYGYKPTPMLNQNSPVMSVVCSDWLNTFAHGTNAGEACILAANQVLLAVESSKVIKDRRMFVFYTELIDLKGDEERKEETVNKKTDVDASASKTKENSAVEVSTDSKDDSPHKECGENDAKGSEDDSQKDKKKKAKAVKEKKKPAKKERKKGGGDSGSDDEVSVDTDSDFKESPRTYIEAKDKYGILFCDCNMDQDTGRLPQEAMFILQQSERMKTIPIDRYPITAINKMCWNPNLQSYIWLASGHQAGLVRICRMQKLRGKVIEVFEGNAQKKIRQLFKQREGSGR
ncbi:uncharacterized protein LOC124163292 [Ischnura elegans]|uniref:uncharacterized protein LOC124163292 n=1 Tax=Ischnura elegans TaxID=197161 RepID=UPI001ED877DC|nr:uncharacterized protein LOC124163292 [Ischnura elegans]